MIKVRAQRQARLVQGDVLRNIEYIEYATESKGNIEISKVLFPFVIVLTQDCDLEQDYSFRYSKKSRPTQDKWLFSVLVAPLYNFEHVSTGEHLTELGMTMQAIKSSRTQLGNLQKNEIPRYHFLNFPEKVPISSSVIDFKHYFSVNVTHLKKLKASNFVCQVSDLYREDISQRFATFLSRIGLP